MEEDIKEVVTMRQLLECGVHFGHQTKRWNPKMKKYIFTSRNGIHVIDLQQSMQLINLAYEFVKEVVKNDGTILFVGTKKQAQDAVKEESERSEMPFVNFRWLGGTLTNISTIRKSINKLKDFEKLKESGDFDLLSKKEQSKKTKLYNKLTNMFFGIKSMIKLPSALFVIDTQKEQLAIKEAKKLNIPVIGVVDTNADPQLIDYPIPANDDAIRAVKLICSIIADAAVAGQAESLLKQEISDEKTEKKDSQKEERSKEENKKKTNVAKKEVPQKKTEKETVKSTAKKDKETTKKITTAKKTVASSEKKEAKKESEVKATKANDTKEKVAKSTTKTASEKSKSATAKNPTTSKKSESTKKGE